MPSHYEDQLNQLAATVTTGGETTDDMRALLEQLIAEIGEDSPDLNRLRFQTRVGATDLMTPFGQKRTSVPKGHREEGDTREGPRGAEELLQFAIKQLLTEGEFDTKGKRALSTGGRAATHGAISPRAYNTQIDMLEQLQSHKERHATTTKVSKRRRKDGKRRLIKDKKTGRAKQYLQKYSTDVLRARGSGLQAGFPVQTKAEIKKNRKAELAASDKDEAASSVAKNFAESVGAPTGPSPAEEAMQLLMDAIGASRR